MTGLRLRFYLHSYCTQATLTASKGFVVSIREKKKSICDTMRLVEKVQTIQRGYRPTGLQGVNFKCHKSITNPDTGVHAGPMPFMLHESIGTAFE
jgi:hypothetical protein